jgi:hypothetical protein
MTVKRAIELALILIGFLPEGEEATPETLLDARDFLNSMLDLWSADGLIVPVIARESFSLPAQQVVTIGPLGDLLTQAITTIVGLQIIDSGGIPYTPISVDELTVRARYPRTDTIPSLYAFLDSYPMSSILFSDIPMDGCTVRVQSTRPFTAASSLLDTMEFSPGYTLAIQFGLAVLLSPKYGKAQRQDIVAIATDSYEKIKRSARVKRGVPLVDSDIKSRYNGFSQFSIYAL